MAEDKVLSTLFFETVSNWHLGLADLAMMAGQGAASLPLLHSAYKCALQNSQPLKWVLRSIWGLYTYRTSALLTQPSLYSLPDYDAKQEKNEKQKQKNNKQFPRIFGKFLALLSQAISSRWYPSPASEIPFLLTPLATEEGSSVFSWPPCLPSTTPPDYQRWWPPSE